MKFEMVSVLSFALGFVTGALLYFILPEMDPARKKWYSSSVSPVVEEFAKFLPLFLGFDPVFMAMGFDVFEVVTKWRYGLRYGVGVFGFHVVSTCLAVRFFPYGLGAAIVAHYFVNRRADLYGLYYIVLVLGFICL